MQHLGPRGTHPRALASGQNDNAQTHTEWISKLIHEVNGNNLWFWNTPTYHARGNNPAWMGCRKVGDC
jgi:hypothetical protein